MSNFTFRYSYAHPFITFTFNRTTVKDLIDETLAEEFAVPELAFTFLFVGADIEVGVLESHSDNCQFGNSYYLRSRLPVRPTNFFSSSRVPCACGQLPSQITGASP